RHHQDAVLLAAMRHAFSGDRLDSGRRQDAHHGRCRLRLARLETRTMTYIMVDVESDGPIPGDYSMTCFGAVVGEPTLERSFYARLKPISERWIPEALAISGFSREETLGFSDPEQVMQNFDRWVTQEAGRRPFFVSDNNGFDWQFINWY